MKTADLTKFLITLDNDEWVVVSAGAINNADKTIYLHLRSTTRFVQQKNGKRPVQIADWLPISLFAEAA